jgi:hypothetical protein
MQVLNECLYFVHNTHSKFLRILVKHSQAIMLDHGAATVTWIQEICNNSDE